MNKTKIAMLLSMLPLCGCHDFGHRHNINRHVRPFVTLLPSCGEGGASGKPARADIVAWAKVILPDNPNFNAIRRVKHKKTPGGYDPGDADNPGSDGDGDINGPDPHAPVPADAGPYDVYLAAIGAGSTGYLAIHLIKPARASYALLDYNDVHGVTASTDNVGNGLCSSLPVRTTANGRQIETFFVNLHKSGAGVPPRSFNLVFEVQSAMQRDGTVKTVDPKVRNEG